MRDWLRHITLIVIAMASLNATAFTERDDSVSFNHDWEQMLERKSIDTVYFYHSWEQMLNVAPDTMIVNPMIDVCTPYEVYIETGERAFDKKIRLDYIAASLNDGFWLMNSKYLKDAFGCRRNNIQGYVPVFFGDKSAYVVSQDIENVPGFNITCLKERIYYIDFVKRKVTKINSKSLNKLLEDYRDLQIRFENMKDSDSDRVLKVFFLMYIDRANEDSSRPDILELMN